MPIINSLFKLTFPDTWKETTVHTFEGSNDSGVQHNLVVSVLPDLEKNVELADFAKSLTETSAGVLPGFQLISEKPASYLTDNPGFEICYSYRPPTRSSSTRNCGISRSIAGYTCLPRRSIKKP